MVARGNCKFCLKFHRFTSFEFHILEFHILRHPFALPLAPSEGSWEGRVR